MEDNQIGRRPKIEHIQNGRQPKRKTIKMEDDQNVRRLKWKITTMEDDQMEDDRNGR